MSYETTIMLAPSPGAPGDFLATVTTENGEDLPFEITLDNYTRDAWGFAGTKRMEDTDFTWKAMQLQSIDGRNKLPGFLKYLKERKKSAYGKFALPDGTTDDDSIKGLFVIPFDQPVFPNTNVCVFKYILNHKLIFKPVVQKTPLLLSNAQPNNRPNTTAAAAHNNNRNNNLQPPPIARPLLPLSSAPLIPLKKGLLGNMLGAQRKTAQHLAAVPKSAVQRAEETKDIGCGSAPSSRSAIAAFREEIHQKLLRFQSDESGTVLRIPLSVADILRKLDPSDHEGKLAIKMDVLKYIVYEATEEIGEYSKWIALKEPSEFLDEVTIAVYKDGCAPPEVLEEITKGDIPDEMKNQQRALQANQLSALVRKATQVDAKNLEKTLKSANNNMAVLNTKKRDRRSIEEIQREMGSDTKQSRLE